MLTTIFNPANYYWNPYSVPYYFVGILTLLEGIFIFIQNRRSLVNLAYGLSCLSVALWLTGMGMIFNSKLELTALIWTRAYFFLGIIFNTPSIYFFSVAWQKALFPHQKNRKEKIVIFNFLCGLGFYIFCLNSDLFIRGFWTHSWGFYPRAGSLYFLFVGWVYTLMVFMLLNFIQVYRKESNPVKKRQAKLMITAFSIGYLGTAEFLLNYGVSLYLLAFVPVFICITVVGYSVVRYRLMDIETVIHKTAAWFFTNLILILPFAVLIYFSWPWYVGLSKIGAFSFLSGLFVLFLLFLRTFQPKIDNFFQRKRYNLEETLGRFVDDIIHLRGINKLIQRIEEAIANTLYSQGIKTFIYNPNKKPENSFLIWLGENDKIAHGDFLDLDPAYAAIKDEAKKYFAQTQSTICLPLVLGDNLLGVINLGKKANLKSYTAIDFHFLTMLKNQSVIAISNSLVYEDIEGQVRARTAELVEAQKQLVQAAKLATMGTLAGGVAHEINNPLTAILTSVQMLLVSGDEFDAEETKESLELIEEATKRCRTIVKKLMAYARKPVESQEILKINLLDVVKKVNSFLAYQLKQENIKLVTEAQDETYFVMGNQNELEQVVTNIVLNAKDAIKRVNQSGRIDILLAKDKDWVRLEIKDQGPGIPRDDVPKIFDPFFTTKGVGKGLGLGLSICQSIVEKHRGSISLKSQENQGSIFTINLPNAG